MAKKINEEEMDIKNEDFEREEEQEDVDPWDAMWGFGPNRHDNEENEDEIEVKNETSYEEEGDESEEEEDSDPWFSW